MPPEEPLHEELEEIHDDSVPPSQDKNTKLIEIQESEPKKVVKLVEISKEDPQTTKTNKDNERKKKIMNAPKVSFTVNDDDEQEKMSNKKDEQDDEKPKEKKPKKKESETLTPNFDYSRKTPDDICIVCLGSETTCYGWLDFKKPNSFPSVVSYQFDQSSRGSWVQKEQSWYVGVEAIKQYGILGRSRAKYLRPIDTSHHDFLAIETSRDAFLAILKYVFHGLNLMENDIKRRTMSNVGPSLLLVFSCPISAQIYNSILTEILGCYVSRVYFCFSPLCNIFCEDPLIDSQLIRNDKIGLVVECGTRMTYVCPVYTGYVMEGAVVSKKYGFYDILKYVSLNMNTRNNENFAEFQKKKGTLVAEEELKKDLIDNGFVALDFDKEMEKNGFHFVKDNKYGSWKPVSPSPTSPSNKSSTETESGKFSIGIEFFYCPESMFNPHLFSDLEDDHSSLIDLVISCLKKSPLALRRRLVSQIFLTGGTTRFKNFVQRFTRELKLAFTQHYPELIPHINVIPSKSEDTWNGAKVIAQQKNILQNFLSMSLVQEDIGPQEMCF